VSADSPPDQPEVYDAGPQVVAQEGVGTPDGLRRLWTPHRMAYIKGEQGTGRDDPDVCPFCRIHTLDDRVGLIVARGESVYAVLNLHPYNPGHLMVVPYRHVAALEDLTPEETQGLADFTRRAVVAIKSASAPHGFNVGLNLGHVAGGSLADHLHQHVVPRWGGDANFITVLAQTKVIPELLADTRDIIAEAWRKTDGSDVGNGVGKDIGNQVSEDSRD
jgi:ATP adenylyltransferase